MGMPSLPAYCPSKHAVSRPSLTEASIGSPDSQFQIIGMTKQMGVDYAQDRIHVNCIAPGGIESPMTAPLIATKEGKERFASLHPWNAMGLPEDIANAALFLASDEA